MQTTREPIMIAYPSEVYVVEISPWLFGALDEGKSEQLTREQIALIPESYLENVFYGFDVEQFETSENIKVWLTPNREKLESLVDDVQNYGDLVNYLVENFGESKYDTWMEGNVRVDDISEDFDIDAGLVSIQIENITPY